MRFSVRRPDVCAGEERRTLRKSAFCTLGLTERRILYPVTHGKAQSVLIDSRKDALCDSQIAQNTPFRHAAAPGRCGATARQAAGHYGKWSNWANALEQPPARLRGGLCQGPQVSVRSLTSRKDALWGCHSHGKAHPAARRLGKVRLSVRESVQTALFRETSLVECAFP